MSEGLGGSSMTVCAGGGVLFVRWRFRRGMRASLCQMTLGWDVGTLMFGLVSDMCLTALLSNTPTSGI